MRKKLKTKIKRILKHILLINRALNSFSNNIISKNIKLEIKNIINSNNSIDIVELKSKDLIPLLSCLKLWRSHSNTIKFFKSKKLDFLIDNIIKSKIPVLNVSYKYIFDKILKLDWPGDVYIVDRTLRNLIIGQIPNDIDISVSCSNQDLNKLCRKYNWEFYSSDKFFTIGKKNSKNYLEGKNIQADIGPNWEGEFTMNMIYYDLKNKIIIDKTGLAIKHIKTNVIDFSAQNLFWDKWFSPDKFFRYIKFRLLNFQCNSDRKQYIYLKMRAVYSSQFFNKNIILFNRLTNNDKKNINKLINDDIDSFGGSLDLKYWYKNLFDSL